ncbi:MULTISPECIES: hypothetical protein [unclassified Pseudoxanthomonas]|uniref:hypothetical protein n=1 Tax=unclassified Pseudoxanthomonas TaxID=2645906 RepID=UPI0030777D0D
MPGAALTKLQAEAQQCDALITNAHRSDANGTAIFPARDQEQITVAAFLNLFIAWESFLEACFISLMTGGATVSGATPNRFVLPPTAQAAQAMIIGINRYFDFANIDNVRKVARIYFEHGYPFEPHLSAIVVDLQDIKMMRNSSAHLTSTTQAALAALAQRITGTPQPGISLYSLLTHTDPRAGNGQTVYATCRDKLLAAAQLIAVG